jgi:hypothetical protein
MKKSNWIVPFSIALLSLTIWAACKKSSSSTDNTSPRVTLLTQAVWKFDTAGASFNKDGVINIGDTTIQPCSKDNTYQFNKDSTGIVDNGAIKCSPSEPQTFSFTWSFSDKGDSVLRSNADPILAGGVNIYSMTSTKIVLYKDTTFFGQNFWYVIALKH